VGREEAEIVSQHFCSEGRHNIHPDDTRKGRNRQPTLSLRRMTPRTPWLDTKMPQLWASTSASKNTTYKLMAQERNCEPGLLLRRTTPPTN
jgi:hypothetical protein